MKILKRILKNLRQSRVNYQVQKKINDIIKDGKKKETNLLSSM